MKLEKNIKIIKNYFNKCGIKLIYIKNLKSYYTIVLINLINV